MKTNGSWTALHIGKLKNQFLKYFNCKNSFSACKKGNFDDLTQILRNKVNVNIKTEDGFTPIFIGS